MPAATQPLEMRCLKPPERTSSTLKALACSLALRLVHITSQITDPPGGEIVRDENDNPTGMLLEEAAIGLVERLVPEPSPEQAADTLNQGLQAAHRPG